MDRAKTDGETARLRRENAALNEQIKLLVRTEQRLYRTKRESEFDLARIKSLEQFALDCLGTEDPEQILRQACDLLRENFRLESVRFVLVREGAEEAFQAWAATQRRVWLATDTAVPAFVLEEHEPPRSDYVRVRVAFCLPLCVTEGVPLGVLVGWLLPENSLSFHRDPPEQRHLPFLRLLTNHLNRALENAELTASLQRQRRELAASNQRLSESLKELESTQNQLVQASKMEALGRLAGGIAHDFNNLLTVVINNATMLHEALPPDSEGQVDVAHIVQAGERAAKITRQLLAFSRVEPRRLSIIDLNVLAQGMVGILERLIGRDISLELDLDPGIGKVRADVSQIEQVLLNLVINARDAIGRAGVIRIATRPGRPEDAEVVGADVGLRGFVALVVEDNGKGMDDEIRAQVFEPFFTTKKMGKGTGLGLSTAYGAVRQNGGYIGVSSSLGGGSCMTVLFPQSAERGLSEDRRPTERKVAARATILIAEDEEQVRSIAARMLRLAGHHVLEASSCESAVAVFEASEEPIDLLVTDILMPAGSGVDLAKILREKRAGLPVIYVSGFPDESLDTTELSHPDHFLQKPFLRETLLSTVQEALSQES